MGCEANTHVTFQGQVISRIELLDVDFNTLYMVLQFLYGGDYTDYETIGGFHSPSYVVFMTQEEMEARLENLPCFDMDSTTEGTGVDGDYDDEHEPESPESEDGDEDEDEDDGFSDSDSNSESSQSQEVGGTEDRDSDDHRTRRFQGHNLFDSLGVYCLATRFNIVPLRLLARDRFYRTAEKVLMFTSNDGNGGEKRWWTHDHQRVYRSKLAKAVFDDFPRAVEYGVSRGIRSVFRDTYGSCPS